MKKEAIREELLELLQAYNANSPVPAKETDFDSTTSTVTNYESASDFGNTSHLSADTDSVSEVVSSVDLQSSEDNSHVVEDTDIHLTAVEIKQSANVDINTNNSNVTGKSDKIAVKEEKQERNVTKQLSKNFDNFHLARMCTLYLYLKPTLLQTHVVVF